MALTRAARLRALADEDLRRVGRGWYASGAPAGIGRWLLELAALAARHPDGRRAGQAAAALLQLVGFDPGAPPTLYRPPTTSGRAAHVRRLDNLEGVVEVCGLPVCGIDELLLGLGAEVHPRPGCAAAVPALSPVELVELAVEAALRRELTTVEWLRGVIDASRPNRPGGRSVLREVLALRPAVTPTESYLETRFVRCCDAPSCPASIARCSCTMRRV